MRYTYKIKKCCLIGLCFINYVIHADVAHDVKHAILKNDSTLVRIDISLKCQPLTNTHEHIVNVKWSHTFKFHIYFFWKTGCRLENQRRTTHY